MKTLHNAGVSAPSVLVGHSMGGYGIRMFASLSHSEVAGMVLVHASPDLYARAPFLVVGGYAGMKYSEPYHTKELDLWIAPQRLNAERAYQALGVLAKLAEIFQRRALTQASAAEILGLTQPKVFALLKGRFRGISEHRLLECLTRLGRDVHIVIKPTPRSRSNGRLTLAVA